MGGPGSGRKKEGLTTKKELHKLVKMRIRKAPGSVSKRGTSGSVDPSTWRKNTNWKVAIKYGQSKRGTNGKSV